MSKRRTYRVEPLTQAELDQLVSYCQHWENGADWVWYYGNKEQFYARHQKIREKLARAAVTVSDE